MPKISIIVPIYRVEKYIRRCLDSISAQIFTDWECLLVDDGSPDNSGKICDEYALKDSRFRVLHKENGGVSSARQTGLDASSGEYIIHVDPDDWIEQQMLSAMYNKAVSTNANVVLCDYYYETDSRSIYCKQSPSALDSSVVLKEMFIHLMGVCWNKLVKRETILNNNVRFPEGINYCEDLCFNAQLFKNNISVEYIDSAFYHYVSNPNSLVSVYKYSRIEENIAVVNFLKNALSNIDATLFDFIINNAKISTKIGVFEHPILSRKKYMTLYEEVNKIKPKVAGKVRCFLFRMSLCGFYPLTSYIFKIYKLLLNK